MLNNTIMSMFDAAEQTLLHGQSAPVLSKLSRFWVPGRLEIMGKHTDYCGGHSLLCAVPLGFAVVATPTPAASSITIHTRLESKDLQITLPLDPELLLEPPPLGIVQRDSNLPPGHQLHPHHRLHDFGRLLPS